MVALFQEQRFADEATSRRCLEDAGWDLNAALQSYMPPVPSSPVAERTLATSHFKQSYLACTAPQSPLDMGFVLGELFRVHCDQNGIDWASEGNEFFQSFNQEAMGNLAELVDNISQAAQRMWTSSLTLQGREFCSILNAAIRSDDAKIARSTAVRM